MSLFDLHGEHPLYHGGSFNGNLLGMVAGTIAVNDYTAADVARIDGYATALRAALEEQAAACGLPIRTSAPVR